MILVSEPSPAVGCRSSERMTRSARSHAHWAKLLVQITQIDLSFARVRGGRMRLAAADVAAHDM